MSRISQNSLYKDLPAPPVQNRASSSTISESRRSHAASPSSKSSRPVSQNDSSSTTRSSVGFPSNQTDEQQRPVISDAAKRRIGSDSDAQSVFTKSFRSNRTATSSSSARSTAVVKAVRKTREAQSVIDEEDEGLDEATREARVVTRLVGKKWGYEG
ncbi:hypothetical protein VKT23_009603 [Stygiomarasmius scandens]|uniref:Uncharacterized protein n=1 Tax=Marasmiellus scandens TaxID=2682957 RepID=A0ABR1J1K8_9AGAR